jgi:hypothetical protein
VNKEYKAWSVKIKEAKEICAQVGSAVAKNGRLVLVRARFGSVLRENLQKRVLSRKLECPPAHVSHVFALQTINPAH